MKNLKFSKVSFTYTIIRRLSCETLGLTLLTACTDLVCLDCKKSGENGESVDSEHPCHPRMILQKTSYSGLALTDQPIYGILTQPYSILQESADYFSEDMADSYITTAHVKFLEAAGARVVPINYRLRKYSLLKMLKQVNGIYIPGDTVNNLYNEKYMDTVKNIIQWA